MHNVPAERIAILATIFGLTHIGQYKSGTEDAKVHNKYKEIIAKYIEYTTENYRPGRKSRSTIVTQKRRHQLRKQKTGNHKFNRQNMPDFTGGYGLWQDFYDGEYHTGFEQANTDFSP